MHARRPKRHLLRALMLCLAGTLAGGLVVARLPDRGVVAERTMSQPQSARFERVFAAGLEALRHGLAAEAATAFAAAHRLRPQLPEPLVNQGFAELALGRPGAAQALFARALALRVDQANAYYGLAEALEAQGDVAGALGAMRTYLHLASADARFRRRAMAAVWEWQSAAAAALPDSGPSAPPPVGHRHYREKRR